MKYFSVIFICAWLVACSQQKHISKTNKQLYQYGVIDGLLAGAMDGDLAIKQLKQHGNFGIGTFNSADGELVAMDNEVYRVRYNGEIIKVSDSDSTPFAEMTHFIADTSFNIDAISYEDLQNKLKNVLNNNSIYAIEIKGSFDSITARAIAPGVKPYPTLKELIESSQRLFHYNKINATCIGFVSPDYLSRVNVPGYHMHFLDSSKTKGGHVFGFEAKQVTVSLMEFETIEIESNRNASFMQLNKRKDRSEELKKIE